MKRGLITWDRTELPPSAFERRLEAVRRVLRERGLSALAVYSDLWRSNQGRFFANYMPYFNRALLLLPAEGKPTLLCGLSPRVYGWIKSVTPIEDVRPAGNFANPLAEIASERGWTRIGVLDADQIPFDLSMTLAKGSLECVEVEAEAVCAPGSDDSELAMRRKAVSLARTALETEVQQGIGTVDYQFVGLLEGRLRKAGAEDLAILLTNGDRAPAPANGARLDEGFSISLALEYRGHWARVSRPSVALRECATEFSKKVEAGKPDVVENLGGSYPYECRPGPAFVALHVETRRGAKRLFYGDTCRLGVKGWEVL